MHFIMLATILLMLNLATAAPALHTKGSECRSEMSSAGLTRRFPGAVAHGIHSITLEDIRYHFKSDAAEENGVPTLNYDLRSNETVLRHAPLYGYDTSFHTIGMRHLDQVLRDMDRKDWYLTNYSTLEKIVHTAHMNEVWTNARAHYQSIALIQPNENVCACVKDVQRNGVLQMLHFMALKIKYPGITSGSELLLKDGGLANWSGNIYRYHFFNEWSEELSKFNFNTDEESVVQRASKELVDGDKGMSVRLDGAKAWNSWKSGMHEMKAHDDFELAVFLYCVLNK